MQRVAQGQLERARPLFAELSAFNLSVEAVLAGTAPGEIYVDALDDPKVGFAITPEGEFLTGDDRAEAEYAALQALIPARAYLIFHPERWETKLPQIWVNPAARRHARHYLRFESMRLPGWQGLIPDGFHVAQVDRAFLVRTDLKHHNTVVERVGSWHSVDYFLQHGFGFCLVEGNTVASCCVADCVVGDKCEIGIFTEMEYRRRGLAALAVAATVEYCLAHAITGIGWHCLQSNVGSRRVAEKVGFVPQRDYVAYSSVLPSENAADLTRQAYEEWARHYERFVPVDFRFGYDAAKAWALAGDSVRSLAHLHALLDQGWQGKPEWLEQDWPFASLRGLAEFEAVVEQLKSSQNNRQALRDQVILDTNVLVAAGFNSRSHAARIVNAVKSGQLHMVWNEETRREIRFVLRRIPPLRKFQVEDLFQPDLQYLGDTFPEKFEVIPDPDDRKFAALAGATGATLITRDDHLLQQRGQLDLTILTPTQFWNR